MKIMQKRRLRYYMEITRTFCGLLAVTLNVFILTHVLGMWK